MLRSLCHFSQKPSCCDFRRDKRTAGEGGQRGRGVDMQRMRGGTAQVGSFTDQRIIIDHTSSVIKSIIESCCVYFGICESWNTEPQLLRSTEKFFPWLDRKKKASPTHQNNGKFLLQLGGVRHGHLQGHDVMFHLGLAVHAFYVSHLQLEGKKKTSQSSNFLFPPAILENQNSQIIRTV